MVILNIHSVANHKTETFFQQNCFSKSIVLSSIDGLKHMYKVKVRQSQLTLYLYTVILCLMVRHCIRRYLLVRVFIYTCLHKKLYTLLSPRNICVSLDITSHILTTLHILDLPMEPRWQYMTHGRFHVCCPSLCILAKSKNYSITATFVTYASEFNEHPFLV